MTIVRTSVARWAHAVSLAEPIDPIKASIAKRMLEGIAPATAAQDSALVHVVFLVRMVLGFPDVEEPPAEQVDAAVLLIMTAFGRLGAFRG